MRPPLPEDQKQHTGTARKDRQRQPGPPVLKRCPPFPADLDESLRDLWRQIGREAVKSGTVTAADIPLLRQIVEVIAQRREYEDQVRNDGLMIIGSAGQLAKHPLITEITASRKLELELRKTLGMSPRARIGLDKPPKKQRRSQAAELLGFPKAANSR